MKNIIKYVLIFVIGGLVLSSCEDLESNYAAMTKDYDKSNTTYFIQYLNASQSFETAIDEAGLPANIETTVGVALLGAPQSSDITVTIVVDESSTMTSSMYTLESTSIVIPAGSTSGSVTLTALAAEMPEDETLKLVLNMDAGGAEAATAAQLNYSMLRIKFCPLDDLNTMVGTYTGVDDWGYDNKAVTSVDGENFMMLGLNKGWMEDFWGETVLEQVPVIVTMKPNGELVIDNQYFMKTDYEGDDYFYHMQGSGMWDNCKKTLLITYDVLYDDGTNLSDYGYGPFTVMLAGS
ncbi:MAG: DUF1735 domain-containing protein [Bacteroidota bacterium]